MTPTREGIGRACSVVVFNGKNRGFELVVCNGRMVLLAA
jgi:hypothetical protein